MIRGRVMKSVECYWFTSMKTMFNACVKNVKDTLHTCSIHSGTLPTFVREKDFMIARIAWEKIGWLWVCLWKNFMMVCLCEKNDMNYYEWVI